MNNINPRKHWTSNDPVLLMCRPEFYGIPEPHATNGHANVMAEKHYAEYLKDPAAYRKEAQAQWRALRDVFNSLGVKVAELDPIAGQLDQVFTADPTLSFITASAQDALSSSPREITILSHFTNDQRQPEVEASTAFIERTFPQRPIVQSYFKSEGTGDNVYDPFRDVFWSGFSPEAGKNGKASEGRSDLRAHATLSSVTGVDVISMNVRGKDEGFFHVDTSMVPLSKGHILCYRDGMSTEAYNKILLNGLAGYGLPASEYLIEVDADDAHRFSCNLRSVGDTLVMPLCSDGLKDRLERAGYDVVRTNMSHFIGNGGAVHCVTNNLMEQRVVGGTCRQYGFERAAFVPAVV